MYTLTRPRNTLFPFGNLFDEFLGAAERNWAPALDFAETADAYVVHADLPGVDPKEVEISLVDDRLEIRGDKTAVQSDEKRGWIRVERRHGAFRRTLQLPGTVDAKKVKAESKNGVLTVTLPKRDDAKPRKIDVKIS